MENFKIKDLHKIAKKLLEKLHGEKNDTATVVTLKGDLGAGKTTLTQELARILGVKENVISPTFIIMKKYKVKDKVFDYLIHIDAYRLSKSSELIHLGWEDILKDKKNLVIIEWPSHVPECIPENACQIELSHESEDTRTIKLHS